MTAEVKEVADVDGDFGDGGCDLCGLEAAEGDPVRLARYLGELTFSQIDKLKAELLLSWCGAQFLRSLTE